jgi:hypothetical protein
LIITARWTLTVADQQDIAASLKEWNRINPRHEIIHLVPNAEEGLVLEKLGLPFAECSNSCFIDENIFRVIPEESKIYRAVYDARLTFFKRHELASRVEGLALITYECDANADSLYDMKTRDAMKAIDATWLNGPFSRDQRMLDAKEIAVHLNRSQVGLMLSEIEGINYASIQYLLCGLPVVTTRNRGGRDAFLIQSM